VSEYIKKFDQFLVRCSENESDIEVLSRFRSRLKNYLRCELIVRDVSTLEQAIEIVQDLDQSQVSSLPRHTGCRDNSNKTTTFKFQPNLFQSQSRFGSNSSTPKREDRDKGIACKSSRSIQYTQSFKCQGFGHVSAQCPSNARTIIETQSDGDQDDLEEIIHDPEEDTWEDDFDVDHVAILGCLLSMYPPSIDDTDRVNPPLSVIRCALTQPKDDDDWRKSSIF